eukprot:CAMPEP_0174314824 /NCGR_PEP_ID=MMETSP0810-20121108/5884_1 /TAXON_ID=73025 ORGANISM="Eutreptiella gymnastica-like, Strain CCMP1594" /NCGR_SAMPLE_ID=MMETSP0810 /ASSEMBLY_ACC=CAM_ASM_000659 /LENGTH=117 /DNA_ID=CAMNT_0015424019 /DNA_START=222 /DNA_END=575 /DNA_ORIENTATION=-
MPWDMGFGVRLLFNNWSTVIHNEKPFRVHLSPLPSYQDHSAIDDLEIHVLAQQFGPPGELLPIVAMDMDRQIQKRVVPLHDVLPLDTAVQLRAVWLRFGFIVRSSTVGSIMRQYVAP